MQGTNRTAITQQQTLRSVCVHARALGPPTLPNTRGEAHTAFTTFIQSASDPRLVDSFDWCFALPTRALYILSTWLRAVCVVESRPLRISIYLTFL